MMKLIEEVKKIMAEQDKLQVENARFRETLERIEWLADECDDDFEALWAAAHVAAEQALADTKCPSCKGSGLKTDENGVVEDDVCPECDGEILTAQ